MDFGLLPPEVNSGRMYAGPGSGPMLAGAAAWDGLAAELVSSASSCQSAIDGLTGGSWQGPTSISMAAAAAPYVAWMFASAAQAEQTATQARAAAAAYETAFAAMVPPSVIAANRALLMTLIATNILGQNTPAIAATESHYAEMWAQDAAAMYGYAGSSATAARLTPFTEPPQTTNPAGTVAQSAAVAQATGTSAGTGTLASSLSTIISFATGSESPLSYFSVGGVPYLLGFQSYLLPRAGLNLGEAASKAAAASSALHASELGSGTQGFGGVGSLSAGVGRAGLVGKLSVPENWTTAAPAIRPAAVMLSDNGIQAAPAVVSDYSANLVNQTALSSLAGRAMSGTGGASARSFGVVGGAAAAEATTATIFVIPADE